MFLGETDSVSDDAIDAEENWRGKNTPKRNIRRRARFSILNPNNLDVQIKKSFLLPNGNNVKIKNIITCFSNTCAFDTMSQIVSALSHDFEEVKCFISKNRGQYEFFQFISNMNSKNPVKKSILTARSTLLEQLFKRKRCSNDFTTINCKCNIEFLIKKLLPPSVHCTANCGCEDSPNKTWSFLPIDLRNLKLQNVQKYVVWNIINKPCRVCHKMPTVCYEPYVCIDVQSLQPLIQSKSLLNSIEAAINLNGHVYNLRGVAEFIPPLITGLKSPGHYIAHVRRSDGVWEMYDDTLQTVSVTKSNRRIIPHTLFYCIK